MSEFVFIVACFVLDFVFSALFPSDPAMIGFILAPCGAFCGMLCLARERSWIHGLYLAFVVGFFSDFFAMNSSLLFSLLFIISAQIMRLWDKHLSSSLFEQTVLLLSTLFVKEALVYLALLAGGSFQMGLMTWLLHRCIPTLLCNVVLVLIVLGMLEVKRNFDARKERDKRREESLFWKKFK